MALNRPKAITFPTPKPIRSIGESDAQSTTQGTWPML